MFKAGFVAIVGRPNVGKSSLLNTVLNYKLSIVSQTPQTTRDEIKGIYNDKTSQIIFVDTPGIHKPKQKLGEYLNNKSFKSLESVDLVLFLQPANEDIGPGDKFIINKILNKNVVVVVTKIDLSNENNLQLKANIFKAMGFKDIIGVSTKIPRSIEHFISFVKNAMSEHKPYYDHDEITDKSMRFVAKELIRETAIENTYDEIPHSIGVEINEFVESDIIKIIANIFVERQSQKLVLVGKNGEMIKTISMASRFKIEENFQQKVYLKVKVKVKKNWTRKDQEIKSMDY